MQNATTGCGNVFRTRQTHFWEPTFLERHFDIGPTFDLDGPIDLPWQLASIHPAQLVDVSTRLQLGRGGFLRSGT